MQQKKADSKKTLGQKKLKKAEKADATHATGIFKDTVPSSLFSMVHATDKGWFQKNTRSKKAKKKLKKADATHATSIFKDTVPSSLFSIIHATEKDWFQKNTRLKKLKSWCNAHTWDFQRHCPKQSIFNNPCNRKRLNLRKHLVKKVWNRYSSKSNLWV